jgi:hypothetical protein
VLISSFGCVTQDARLQQHQEKLESLARTTEAVAAAWLAGSVSGTYAGTALEETSRLLEKERSALAGTPELLVDPRGARLSQRAERMSRLLGLMIHDVDAADGQALRQRITDLGITGPGITPVTASPGAL